MFDKLDDILMRLEEVLNQLSEPDVAADAAKFQKLMKEQAELQPIADAYKDYKTQKQTIEESLMLLEEESDEEMREMLKEELSDAKKRVEELEQELKVLLLPKDPNDDKNVIVEFRAVPAETRRHSLPQKSAVCTSNTQRAAAGKQS